MLPNIYDNDEFVPPELITRDDRNPGDIRAFVEHLKGVDGDICRRVILEGESFKDAAAAAGVPYAKVRRIAKAALAPLARDLGISVTSECDGRGDGPRVGRGVPRGRKKRYSGRRKSGKSAGEVVAKIHTLSLEGKKND